MDRTSKLHAEEAMIREALDDIQTMLSTLETQTRSGTSGRCGEVDTVDGSFSALQNDSAEASDIDDDTYWESWL